MAGRFGVCLVLFVALNPRVHGASGPDPNQVQSDSATTFTFAPGQWPLCVPIRFGPRTYDFTLDTGCTGTLFDLSFRPQLGKPRRSRKVSGPGKPIAMQVFAAPRAFLGPFSLADCNEVMCADLKGFAETMGRDVHGVLGMDVLKKHIVQIDFDEGRIAFLGSEQGDPREWGEAFPIMYNSMMMPQIRLAVNGQPEQDFVIDTGCEMSGALGKDSFRRIVMKGRLKPVDTAMFAVSGVVKSGLIRADRVTAGPFEYRGSHLQ